MVWVVCAEFVKLFHLDFLCTMYLLCPPLFQVDKASRLCCVCQIDHPYCTCYVLDIYYVYRWFSFYILCLFLVSTALLSISNESYWILLFQNLPLALMCSGKYMALCIKSINIMFLAGSTISLVNLLNLSSNLTKDSG